MSNILNLSQKEDAVFNKPKLSVDAATVLLIDRVAQLDRDLAAAKKKIEELERENGTLYLALSRPAVASVTKEQVEVLAELIITRTLEKEGHVN